MILVKFLCCYVIGSSTSLEYSLRGIYEQSIGKISYSVSGRVAEDDYSQRIAEDYVRFIKEKPWYEFDFIGALKGLWLDNSFFGKGLLRKVERKYILSSEYIVKALYGKLIGYGTHATYGVASEETVSVVKFDSQPADIDCELIGKSSNDNYTLALPRLDKYKNAAELISSKNGQFENIAGNSSYISISVIANPLFEPNNLGEELFRQEVLTMNGKQRVFFIVKVNNLSETLKQLKIQGIKIEHIYDY